MLSCYDAELSYDTHTDTFQARYKISLMSTFIHHIFFLTRHQKLTFIGDFRYPPHGRRAVAVEKGVTWDRLREAPIDASPHHLHVSDYLKDLKPGDHIEIQWRRNKEFPYGK